MMIDWKDLFDNYGVKLVSKTDKNKGAYVLNAGQLEALAAAKTKPSTKRPATPFQISVLFDPSVDSVQASFYHAQRSQEADRDPEPRMGRQIISSWLEIGDEVIIGNIGTELYAAKLSAATSVGPSAASEIASKVDPKTILARAKKAKGKPKKSVKRRVEYIRDPYVVAGAIVRSNGICEMPNCTTTLFARNDGSPFLEVHHIIPLAENGDDTLVNAAALCPMCHRELHFGALKSKKRKSLKATIAALRGAGNKS